MLTRKIGLITLLASLAGGEIYAGDFNNYATGDVLICFRKPGVNDLVVDAGSIATFSNAAVNQRITISQYNGSQLSQVGTNGVSWSVFTWLADDTLFITKPRLAAALNSQTTPWLNKSSANQHNTDIRMATIPLGAKDNLAFSGVNTATAVVEEDNSVSNPNYPNGVSYRDAIFGQGATANFYTTFQGVPENTTLANFTTSGKVVRSDFYQLSPTDSGSGKFMGYFELSTNGAMTYVAYPTTTPVIQSLTHVGTTTTITYTAGLYGTYTLRGITSLTSGTPQISWPSIQTLTSGDTAVHSATFTDTDGVKFYTITAQ